MPEIIINAGPNGAGTTTFAEKLLPTEAACFELINADRIAAGFCPFQEPVVASGLAPAARQPDPFLDDGSETG